MKAHSGRSTTDGLTRRYSKHTFVKSAAQRSSRRRSDSDALPFGRLWYGEPNAISNAMSYAKFFSRSLDAVIRVYDDAGNVIETYEHKAGC